MLETLSPALAALKKSHKADYEACRQQLTGSVWRRGIALFALVGAGVSVQAQPSNPVVASNRILLTIVRTPGAQPATIHPTRSFAIMHAAIYDAVNSIQSTYGSYMVQLSGISPSASKDAAAAAAAHEVWSIFIRNSNPCLTANSSSGWHRFRMEATKRRESA